jgi:hypothetical protein
MFKKELEKINKPLQAIKSLHSANNILKDFQQNQEAINNFYKDKGILRELDKLRKTELELRKFRNSLAHEVPTIQVPAYSLSDNEDDNHG